MNQTQNVVPTTGTRARATIVESGSPASALRWLAPAGLAASLVLAWACRFIQDDAFISFRYSAHLAHGLGLTWNPGERIEGYTNFLWTVLMAAPIRLGIEPIAASYALGLTCFALTLIGTWRAARNLLGSRKAGWIAAAFLATNFSFLSYATGGLETQLQTCLLVWAFTLAFGRAPGDAPSVRAALAISLLAAAAFLTRMDSLLILGLFALALVGRSTGEHPVSRSPGFLLALVVPFLLVAGGWLAWKQAYYGEMVPNTFHLRVTSLRSLRHGVFYLRTFFTSYALLPLVAVIAFACFRRRPPFAVFVALGVLAVWCAYIVWAGGDFMEFRFMVPVLPLLALATAWVLSDVVRERWLAAALGASIVAGSISHAVFYVWTNEIESITTLVGNLSPEGSDWIAAGKALGRTFRGGRILMATSAAGAIPFYSNFDTVDMLGLNDRWIARNGLLLGNRPGHLRETPFTYVLQRHVHLVVGNPWVDRRDGVYPGGTRVEQVRRFRLPDVTDELIPDGARVLEVPVDEGHKIYVLELFREPAIDRAVDDLHLVTHEIPPAGAPRTDVP